MVRWLGLVILGALALVFDVLARRRARPHPRAFGVRKGAGIDAEVEGGGLGTIDALAVDGFEERVVRQLARLFACLGSPGLEFLLVALRGSERGIGRRGREEVGWSSRGRWGGGRRSRVGRGRVCQPERGGVLGVVRGGVLGVVLGLIHEARGVLLKQLLFEALAHVEGNGGWNGAADGEVEGRVLFAGSKGASACAHASAVRSKKKREKIGEGKVVQRRV
jgi:hypothetical protein